MSILRIQAFDNLNNIYILSTLSIYIIPEGAKEGAKKQSNPIDSKITLLFSYVFNTVSRLCRSPFAL